LILKLTKDQFKQVYDQGFEATFLLFDVLQQAVESLEKRVAHLEGILAKDSHNSSKPPSTDGFKRPPKSLRDKSNKAPGGQHGHPGTTLMQVDNPDITEILSHPDSCSCGRHWRDAATVSTEKRQVFDIPIIKTHVTEYQASTKICACGQKHTAEFPAGVSGAVQYGSGVKAMAIYLMVTQLLPMDRTQEIFREILHTSLSQGTLLSIMQQGYDGLEKTDQTLQELIVQTPVVHADETGCDVGKDSWWIHALSTLEYTWYFCDERRGKDALSVVALISRFKGRLVHDGWKTYLHYVCKHALCNAHHLRELVFIDEHLKENWAHKMKRLLLEIKNSVDDALKKNKKALARKLEKRFRCKYLAILREGFAIQPPPVKRKSGQRGRLKQPTAKNLLDRLRDHIDDVLAFMYDFAVPFTNNLVERDLRMVKVKLKISGCFRTAFGASAFCRIRGYISTVRKQNLNVLEYVKKIFIPFSKNLYLLPV